MAYTMGTSRVVIPALPGLSYDAGGDAENKGVVVHTTIDITSYTNGSEDVPAGEFGLSKIFGVQLQEAEIELHDFSTVIPAGGAEAQITALVRSTGAEAAGAVNIGVLSCIAWGEGATAGVEN